MAWGHASVAASNPNKIYDCASRYYAAGRYLDAIELIEPSLKKEGEDKASLWALWSWIRPQIGGSIDSAMQRPRRKPTLNSQDESALKSADFKPALDEIMVRARQTQFVIVNENHRLPKHRAFTIEILRNLRDQGYRYLAVETLLNDGDEAVLLERFAKMASSGVVEMDAGYFSRDPVMASMLIEAIQLGYQLVAYEGLNRSTSADFNEQINFRESEQSRNLIERTISRDPDARVIVHVGFDHAIEEPVENPDGSVTTWLASLVKIKTGIDPLTIDQTLLDDEQQFHLADSEPFMPGVPMDNKGHPLIFNSAPGLFDLHIIHPRDQMIQGRPNWLWRLGRQAVSVPAEALSTTGPVLLQAHRLGASEMAVPLDQVILNGEAPAPVLLVPPGVRYELRLQITRPAGNINDRSCS